MRACLQQLTLCALLVLCARQVVAHSYSSTRDGEGPELENGHQRSIHKGLNEDRIPEGWDHQVSDGGEPTLRFIWARQALLASNFQSAAREYELKWRAEGSAGYLTEASISLSGRWGVINTPWWSSSPERADYISQPAPVIGNAIDTGRRELYLWGGLKLRARAYNAFLQGQFRESKVEVDAHRVERIVGEAWLGVTWQMSQQYRLAYVLRYQTREIKDGPTSRDMLWAGLVLSRDLYVRFRSHTTSRRTHRENDETNGDS